MNNKGYTIPELIVVAAVLGIFTLVVINKASYAFVNTEEMTENATDHILEKSASLYAKSIEDSFKEEKTKYILSNELIEAGYLVDEDIYKNTKIKLDYSEETGEIKVEIIH